MKNVLLKKFIATLNTFSDGEYLMAKIELEAAPILAGIKPSSLMTFSKDSRNLYQMWETFKDKCCAILRLQYFEMKKTERSVLVLFYNPVLISEVVLRAENKDFLCGMGYPAGVSLQQILQILRERFKHTFPHEIGLFLGIAKEDVDGFIQNGGAGCLFCRYWKVYHRPHEAICLFRRYDTARYTVMKSICQRNSLVNMPA
ncbi:DUF3793 family protein [Sporomusa sp. KB1]|uniref:DUF3793 family protein n=1 Tax=Sporomusa sp. KB1 TaxID=943346 RepID=UPI0011AA659B|nr:DUF3793 family protein [Sporomusa sp. KB1]TWH46671.1 uncharacterized protein DUF3793 [Sporomusa sp. KB1]